MKELFKCEISECMRSKDPDSTNVNKLARDCVSGCSLGLRAAVPGTHHVTAGNSADLLAPQRCLPYPLTVIHGTAPWVGWSGHVLRKALLNIFLPHQTTAVDIFRWCHSERSWPKMGTSKLTSLGLFVGKHSIFIN